MATQTLPVREEWERYYIFFCKPHFPGVAGPKRGLFPETSPYKSRIIGLSLRLARTGSAVLRFARDPRFHPREFGRVLRASDCLTIQGGFLSVEPTETIKDE